MEKIKVIIQQTKAGQGMELPKYETDLSAGMDLRACTHESITLQPGDIYLVPTGIKIQIPDGYEAQIRPRSGLALKHGISMVNSPGTIDADYRGEIKVIMINQGSAAFTFEHNDRIAQMVFCPVVQAEFEFGELSDTDRGEGGFHSTGNA